MDSLDIREDPVVSSSCSSDISLEMQSGDYELEGDPSWDLTRDQLEQDDQDCQLPKSAADIEEEVNVTSTSELKKSSKKWKKKHLKSKHKENASLKKINSKYIDKKLSSSMDVKAFPDKKRVLFLFKPRERHIVMKKHGVKMYKCDVCSGVYRQKFSLKRHFLRSHVNIKFISEADISNCKIITPDEPQKESQYTNDMKSSSGRKRYKPDNVTFLESNESRIMRGLYKCHACANVCFDLESELKDHYESHPDAHRRKYSCDKCGAVFFKKQILSRHLAGHSSRVSFMCKKCGLKFGTKLEYRHHLASHSNGKICKYCSKSFSTNANRKRHERIHEGLKPFSCVYCLMSFPQQKDLDRHLRKQHSSLIINCPVCTRIFTSEQALKIHASLKHSDIYSKDSSVFSSKSTVQNSPKPAVKPVKIFNCTFCKKSFTSVYTMLKHRNQAHPFLHGKRRTHRRQVKQATKTVQKKLLSKHAAKKMAEENEDEFYMSLSHKIADNLLNYVDGKTSQLSLKEYNFEDHNEPSICFTNRERLSWSCYNFPTDFDVDSALQNRGHEIKIRSQESNLSLRDRYFYATGLSRVELSQSMSSNGSYSWNDCDSSSEFSDIDSLCVSDSTDFKNMSLEEKKKLIGNEVITITICSVCKEKFESVNDFDEHCDNNHPNVVCTYIQIEGGKDFPPAVPEDLCRQHLSPAGVYFSYNVPHVVTRNFLKCTKCKAVFCNSSDLHLHIIKCGGNVNSVPKYIRKFTKQKRIKRTMKNRIDLSIKQKPTKKQPEKNQFWKNGATGMKYDKNYFISKPGKTFRMSSLKPFPFKNATIISKTDTTPKAECPGCKRSFRADGILKAHIKFCLKRIPRNKARTATQSDLQNSYRNDPKVLKDLSVVCTPLLQYQNSSDSQVTNLPASLSGHKLVKQPSTNVPHNLVKFTSASPTSDAWLKQSPGLNNHKEPENNHNFAVDLTLKSKPPLLESHSSSDKLPTKKTAVEIAMDAVKEYSKSLQRGKASPISSLSLTVAKLTKRLKEDMKHAETANKRVEQPKKISRDNNMAFLPDIYTDTNVNAYFLPKPLENHQSTPKEQKKIPKLIIKLTPQKELKKNASKGECSPIACIISEKHDISPEIVSPLNSSTENGSQLSNSAPASKERKKGVYNYNSTPISDKQEKVISESVSPNLLKNNNENSPGLFNSAPTSPVSSKDNLMNFNLCNMSPTDYSFLPTGNSLPNGSNRTAKRVSKSRSSSGSQGRISPSLESIVNSIKQKLHAQELEPQQSVSWMDDDKLIIPTPQVDNKMTPQKDSNTNSNYQQDMERTEKSSSTSLVDSICVPLKVPPVTASSSAEPEVPLSKPIEVSQDSSDLKTSEQVMENSSDTAQNKPEPIAQDVCQESENAIPENNKPVAKPIPNENVSMDIEHQPIVSSKHEENTSEDIHNVVQMEIENSSLVENEIKEEPIPHTLEVINLQDDAMVKNEQEENRSTTESDLPIPDISTVKHDAPTGNVDVPLDLPVQNSDNLQEEKPISPLPPDLVKEEDTVLQSNNDAHPVLTDGIKTEGANANLEHSSNVLDKFVLKTFRISMQDDNQPADVSSSTSEEPVVLSRKKNNAKTPKTKPTTKSKLKKTAVVAQTSVCKSKAKKTSQPTEAKSDDSVINTNGNDSSSMSKNIITLDESFQDSGEEVHETIKLEDKEDIPPSKRLCPYCFLQFAYLSNFRRHIQFCKERPENVEAEVITPPPGTSNQPLYLPKKDEVEESMLNLLRHQTRQIQMMKEAEQTEGNKIKGFQTYNCNMCHRIYLSLFKLLQHQVTHKLQGTDAQDGVADDDQDADQFSEMDSVFKEIQPEDATDYIGEVHGKTAASTCDMEPATGNNALPEPDETAITDENKSNKIPNNPKSDDPTEKTDESTGNNALPGLDEIDIISKVKTAKISNDQKPDDPTEKADVSTENNALLDQDITDITRKNTAKLLTSKSVALIEKADENIENSVLPEPDETDVTMEEKTDKISIDHKSVDSMEKSDEIAGNDALPDLVETVDKKTTKPSNIQKSCDATEKADKSSGNNASFEPTETVVKKKTVKTSNEQKSSDATEKSDESTGNSLPEPTETVIIKKKTVKTSNEQKSSDATEKSDESTGNNALPEPTEMVIIKKKTVKISNEQKSSDTTEKSDENAGNNALPELVETVVISKKKKNAKLANNQKSGDATEKADESAGNNALDEPSEAVVIRKKKTAKLYNYQKSGDATEKSGESAGNNALDEPSERVVISKKKKTSKLSNYQKSGDVTEKIDENAGNNALPEPVETVIIKKKKIGKQSNKQKSSDATGKADESTENNTLLKPAKTIKRKKKLSKISNNCRSVVDESTILTESVTENNALPKPDKTLITEKKKTARKPNNRKSDNLTKKRKYKLKTDESTISSENISSVSEEDNSTLEVNALVSSQELETSTTLVIDNNEKLLSDDKFESTPVKVDALPEIEHVPFVKRKKKTPGIKKRLVDPSKPKRKYTLKKIGKKIVKKKFRRKLKFTVRKNHKKIMEMKNSELTKKRKLKTSDFTKQSKNKSQPKVSQTSDSSLEMDLSSDDIKIIEVITAPKRRTRKSLGKDLLEPTGDENSTTNTSGEIEICEDIPMLVVDDDNVCDSSVSTSGTEQNSTPVAIRNWCPICEKRFQYTAYYKRHMLVFHNHVIDDQVQQSTSKKNTQGKSKPAKRGRPVIRKQKKTFPSTAKHKVPLKSQKP